jgi:hypothetical protein
MSDLDEDLNRFGVTMPPPVVFSDGDVSAFVDAASDEHIKKEAAFRGLTPSTRRLVIVALLLITLTAIGVYLALVLNDEEPSELVLGLAASGIGGLAGLAVPRD